MVTPRLIYVVSIHNTFNAEWALSILLCIPWKGEPCNGVQSLQGLESIHTIGADATYGLDLSLHIESCSELASITPLMGLRGDLPGIIKISGASRLSNLRGLEHVTNAGSGSIRCSIFYYLIRRTAKASRTPSLPPFSSASRGISHMALARDQAGCQRVGLDPPPPLRHPER